MELTTNIGIAYLAGVSAAVGLLGSIVYLNNPRSITGRTFVLFSLLTIAWSVVNYLSIVLPVSETALFVLRVALCFAVFHSLVYLRFCLVFPKDEAIMPRWYRLGLVPASLAMALLTLTPLVIAGVASTNHTVKGGPALPLFALVTFLNIAAGIRVLLSKHRNAAGIERVQYSFILGGTTITFALLLTVNLIFPAFLGISSFVEYGALSFLPFIVATTYAIVRHHLLETKVLAAEIFVSLLIVALLSQVLFAGNQMELVRYLVIFVLVLIVGILLIRNVIREVATREEMERLAEDLAHANERLRDLDKRKSEFISIASHQLRTPLTAIKGYSSMMLEGSFGALSTDTKEAVERIFQSTLRLIMIIEDFLTISKIEQGKLTYNFAPVNVKEVVENIIKDMQSNVHEKGLTLRLEPSKLASDEFDVLADSGKLFQVLTNLVDNAIKYTPKGGITIRINRKTDTNRVIVCISDTGVGMNDETKSKLFQKFSRAEDAFKINTSGSGLGLYVAQQIMQAHNGQIRVESPGVGKGTTFFVEMPAL